MWRYRAAPFARLSLLHRFLNKELDGHRVGSRLLQNGVEVARHDESVLRYGVLLIYYPYAGTSSGRIFTPGSYECQVTIDGGRVLASNRFTIY